MKFLIGLSDQSFLYFLLIISFLFFMIDVSTLKCKIYCNPGFYLFLYLHHLLAAFLYFGWLSKNKSILIFYDFLIFLIILHWFTNDQKCICTQIVNYYCGIADDEGFHDIFYFTGIKQNQWFNNFIYSYLIIAFIYSAFKITRF